MYVLYSLVHIVLTLVNANHPELMLSASRSQLGDLSILSHVITPPKESFLEPMHKLFSISYDRSRQPGQHDWS
jgi:hypothetical protein